MTEGKGARSGLQDSGAAGFTLLEMLVALALFALISLAGVSLVETVLGVQQRVEGRAERLAEVQRAVYLITADFEQLTMGPVRDEDGVQIERASATGAYPVSYRFADSALLRRTGDSERVLLPELASVSWRFLHDDAWTSEATVPAAASPVAVLPGMASGAERNRPRAVELTIALAGTDRGPRGSVRRVFELPSAP